MNESKKDFFEWAIEREEKIMSKSTPQERKLFLDTLRNNPEVVLESLRANRKPMKVLYMAYNPIRMIINDLEVFHKEWFSRLKKHFLPEG